METNYTITFLQTKEELLESWEMVNGLYPDLELDEYRNNLNEMIEKDYRQILISDGDKKIGLTGYWLGYKLWCGKYLEMDNVFVAEEYRGKGVAQLLSNEAYKIASEKECKMMCLDAYTENLPALKFYVKEGFVPRGFHYIKHL